MRSREQRARSGIGAPNVKRAAHFRFSIADFRLKTAAAALLVAMASSIAAGAVRFYFTSSADPAGLTDPSLAFKDTGGNGTDGTDYALNGELPAVSAPTIDARKGEFLYLWVAFEKEPNNAKIQGINITIDGDGWETARGLYLGDDSSGGGGGSIRWNLGSQTSDPIVLVAIEEPGVVNSKTDAWLYYGGDTRTALLGAIEFDEKFNGEVRLGLCKQEVTYYRRSSPHVKLGANEETLDGGIWVEGQPPRWSTDPDAYVVPEPASLILLVFSASTFLLRRTHR